MCLVAGCARGLGGGRFGASFRTLCGPHSARDRRHGDPLQEPIRAAHLVPYMRMLRRRKKLRPAAPAWEALETRWSRLVQDCRDTLKVYEAGEPMNRWKLEAAGEIVKVAEQATAEAAWMAAVGMVMMREAEPRRFRSERSFRVQIGRRVRQLALSNRGSYWNPQKGRFMLVFRDPSPRSAALLGDMLTELFGVAGIYFARQEQAEVDAKAAERTAFYAAMNDAAPEGSAL